LRITALDRQSPLQDRPALAVCFAAESNLPALVAAEKLRISRSDHCGPSSGVWASLAPDGLPRLERPATPGAGRRCNADDGSGPGDFVPGLRPFQGWTCDNPV